MKITREQLLDILDYDKNSGIFRWKKSNNKKIRVGDIAGSKNKRGYIQINTSYGIFLAHRLAWLHEGLIVPKILDHINGNRSDNRFSNLRSATHAMNAQNMRLPSISNKTGYLGVVKDGGKFGARMTLNGKQIYLGNYDTPEEAHSKYLEAKRVQHPGCTI